MKVVILAGGLGTRLGEETDHLPKPMVQVGERPILWHIMKIYGHYGLTDFVVCLGHKGSVIRNFFQDYRLHASDITFDMQTGLTEVHQQRTEPWKVTLVDTGEQTQTGGRLKRIAPYLDEESFCFTYGDGLADIDIPALLKFHANHGKTATVSAVAPPGRFGALALDGDCVTAMAEKMDTVDTQINGGFFVLERSVLDLIENDATVWEQAPMKTLAETGQLRAFRHSGFWHPMDTLRDKRYLDSLWMSGKAQWKLWA